MAAQAPRVDVREPGRAEDAGVFVDRCSEQKNNRASLSALCSTIAVPQTASASDNQTVLKKAAPSCVAAGSRTLSALRFGTPQTAGDPLDGVKRSITVQTRQLSDRQTTTLQPGTTLQTVCDLGAKRVPANGTSALWTWSKRSEAGGLKQKNSRKVSRNRPQSQWLFCDLKGKSCNWMFNPRVW